MNTTDKRPFLVWRCKLCRVEYREYLSPMADSVRSLLETRNDRPLFAYNLHECDEGGNIGVGELIGGNQMAPEEDEDEDQNPEVAVDPL